MMAGLPRAFIFADVANIERHSPFIPHTCGVLGTHYVDRSYDELRINLVGRLDHPLRFNRGFAGL